MFVRKYYVDDAEFWDFCSFVDNEEVVRRGCVACVIDFPGFDILWTVDCHDLLLDALCCLCRLTSWFLHFDGVGSNGLWGMKSSAWTIQDLIVL